MSSHGSRSETTDAVCSKAMPADRSLLDLKFNFEADLPTFMQHIREDEAAMCHRHAPSVGPAWSCHGSGVKVGAGNLQGLPTGCPLSLFSHRSAYSSLAEPSVEAFSIDKACADQEARFPISQVIAVGNSTCLHDEPKLSQRLAGCSVHRSPYRLFSHSCAQEKPQGQAILPSQQQLHCDCGSVDEVASEGGGTIGLGHLDGRWTHRFNSDPHLVEVISRGTLYWFDGTRSRIEAQGIAEFSVDLQGTTYRAHLSAGCLHWSDGDVWVPASLAEEEQEEEAKASRQWGARGGADDGDATPRASSAAAAVAGDGLQFGLLDMDLLSESSRSDSEQEGGPQHGSDSVCLRTAL